jgi:hypothetical protein
MIGARKDERNMSAAPRLTESPRDPQDAWLEREMSRTNAAFDAQTVAAVKGPLDRPIAFQRDGSVWQWCEEPEGEGGRRVYWKEVVPLPRSPRAESYTEGPDGDSPDGPFLPGDEDTDREVAERMRRQV